MANEISFQQLYNADTRFKSRSFFFFFQTKIFPPTERPKEK